MRTLKLLSILLPFLLVFTGCPETPDPPANGGGTTDTSARANTPPPPPAPEIPVYGYEVVKSYPHDPMAFTQGLIFDNGVFYESTGLHDSSYLRKVEIETGRVLQERKVPKEHFAEGLALLDGKLYQLTWQSHVCFVYDKESFQPVDTFNYYNEGWGIATDGTVLMMSDGSNFIRYIDPAGFQVQRVLGVFIGHTPVNALNELEYVKGEIWANIWQSDRIARIDPATGAVKGWIDLAGILPQNERTPQSDVMNGIAYDPKGDRIFITGKRWPKVYEIRLKEKAKTIATL